MKKFLVFGSLLGFCCADYVVAQQIVCDGRTCRVVPSMQILGTPTEVQSASTPSQGTTVTVQSAPVVQYTPQAVSYGVPVVGSVMSDGGIVTSVEVQEVRYVEHNSVRTPVRTVVRSIANRRRERVSSNGVWFPGKGLIRFLRG